jgi:esterase/lipase
MEPVDLISGTGRKLSGRLYQPPNPAAAEAAVLFLHGWSSDQGSATAMARSLAQLGYACLSFDLPGHGQSQGDLDKLSRQDFLADTLAAYDILTQLTTAAGVVAVGSSFGGYLACLLAQHRPVAALALRAPANYPDEGFDEPQVHQVGGPALAAWRQQRQPATATRSLRALSQFTGPALLVASEFDEILPPQATDSYYRAASQAADRSWAVLSGAPHSIGHDTGLRQRYIHLLTGWIMQLGTSS